MVEVDHSVAEDLILKGRMPSLKIDPSLEALEVPQEEVEVAHGRQVICTAIDVVPPGMSQLDASDIIIRSMTLQSDALNVLETIITAL